jgi:hypothetical protein
MSGGRVRRDQGDAAECYRVVIPVRDELAHDQHGNARSEHPERKPDSQDERQRKQQGQDQQRRPGLEAAEQGFTQGDNDERESKECLPTGHVFEGSD